MRYIFYLLSVLLFISNCKVDQKDLAPNTTIVYSDISTYNSDSSINIIVEIPAGTTAKYEMDKESLILKMDSINGMPRFIKYLGYPGNYGMIPNTLLSKKLGGDGDPLDAILLGSAVTRGSIVPGKIIGVLQLLDNGEQDDKLIAVPLDKTWKSINNLQDLDDQFPGVKLILLTFFENYKGQKQMEYIGWKDDHAANQLIKDALVH